MHRFSYTPALIFTLLLTLLLLPGPAIARNPDWAQPVTLKDSDNFFKVAPCLYRSAQPSADAMKQYEAMGIRTVINMRALHSDNDEAEGTSLILQRVPINTWHIEDEDVVSVLTLLRTAQRPILLHCQHGADRTGLMMAMYRIVEQGWTKEAALDEMQNGGYGYHSIWTNIVEYIEEVDVERIRSLVDGRTVGQTPPACPE